MNTIFFQPRQFIHHIRNLYPRQPGYQTYRSRHAAATFCLRIDSQLDNQRSVLYDRNSLYGISLWQILIGRKPGKGVRSSIDRRINIIIGISFPLQRDDVSRLFINLDLQELVFQCCSLNLAGSLRRTCSLNDAVMGRT